MSRRFGLLFGWFALATLALMEPALAEPASGGGGGGGCGECVRARTCDDARSQGGMPPTACDHAILDACTPLEASKADCRTGLAQCEQRSAQLSADLAAANGDLSSCRASMSSKSAAFETIASELDKKRRDLTEVENRRFLLENQVASARSSEAQIRNQYAESLQKNGEASETTRQLKTQLDAAEGSTRVAKDERDLALGQVSTKNSEIAVLVAENTTLKDADTNRRNMLQAFIASGFFVFVTGLAVAGAIYNKTRKLRVAELRADLQQDARWSSGQPNAFELQAVEALARSIASEQASVILFRTVCGIAIASAVLVVASLSITFLLSSSAGGDAFKEAVTGAFWKFAVGLTAPCAAAFKLADASHKKYKDRVELVIKLGLVRALPDAAAAGSRSELR
jgi:hypothetical protein